MSAVGVPDVEGEPYRWALEFQCVEQYHSIVFIGINFYSRARIGIEAERSYEEMLLKSRELGIDEYWGGDISGLKRIDHEGCYYDNVPKAEEFLQ